MMDLAGLPETDGNSIPFPLSKKELNDRSVQLSKVIRKEVLAWTFFKTKNLYGPPTNGTVFSKKLYPANILSLLHILQGCQTRDTNTNTKSFLM